jgi:hypothetical protein
MSRQIGARRMLIASAAAATLVSLIPSPASGVVSCTYDPTFHQATVALSQPGDVAEVARSGRAITVNGVPCGIATVDNTARVEFRDHSSSGDVTAIISLRNGPFAPGFAGNCFSGDLLFSTWLDYDSTSAGDRLVIRGAPVTDRIRFGVFESPCNGIDFRVANLNVGEATPDPNIGDVSSNHVDHWIVKSAGGADKVSGAGGAGVGSAFNTRLQLFGGNGDDALTGGTAGDIIRGERGHDLLIGGPGPDELFGGGGIDTCRGGGGADILAGCERP